MHDSPGVVQHLLGYHLGWLFSDSGAWTCFGFLGTFLFGSRIVIQWLCSERHQKIVVPPIFWHLSFWGSLISLIYAVHIDKLPVIFGFIFLPFIYARNLILLGKGQRDISGGPDA